MIIQPCQKQISSLKVVKAQHQHLYCQNKSHFVPGFGLYVYVFFLNYSDPHIIYQKFSRVDRITLGNLYTFRCWQDPRENLQNNTSDESNYPEQEVGPPNVTKLIIEIRFLRHEFCAKT